jgi:L-threonylcarbamoyladenylate synthase
MADAQEFAACLAGGGVVVFPADTVYGLACDPGDAAAVSRLYGLKGRSEGKPSAVMIFAVEPALAALPELGPRLRALLERLLPGALTALLPNPEGRFPLACGEDLGTLGLRVPVVPTAAAWLGDVEVPVLQSSANLAGGPDPRSLADVPDSIRHGADLVVDGGELPGTPSTVVDLRRFEEAGEWSVVREGALAVAEIEAAVAGLANG